MIFTLEIDRETCIQCGKCVRICPAAIFSQLSPGGDVSIHNRENCIKCGHCVAICPTDSVKHSFFPSDKVHPIDRSQLPTADQLSLLISSRRSNRAFSKKLVPDEFFDRILDAAHRAPTASNQQEVEFTLVTDPEILKQIIHLTADVFEEKIKNVERPLVGKIVKTFMPDMYRMASRLTGLIKMVRNGKDPILRGASSVIFIHSAADAYYGRIDCNLAYQNGSLMAESLGVSQFYTGFVCRAIDEDKKGRFNDLLGIKGKIHAGLALGLPAFTFGKYIDKKEISVRRI